MGSEELVGREMSKMTSILLKFRAPWLLRTYGLELSGVAVSLAAVGIAAVYFFYRRRKPKGPFLFPSRCLRRTRLHALELFDFA